MLPRLPRPRARWVNRHSSLAQLVEQAAVNRRVAGSSPAAGAISSLFEKGDQLLNRSPGHREVIGASPFWRRVAGMRDARDRDRDLRARSGESARAIGNARSLSPGPFGAETGEREPGSRLPHRRFRFTAGEAPEISNPFSAESAARRAATLLVNLAGGCSTGRAAEFGSIDDRSYLLSRPDVEQAETAGSRRTRTNPVIVHTSSCR